MTGEVVRVESRGVPARDDERLGDESVAPFAILDVSSPACEEVDEQHALLPASDPARDAGRAAAQVRFVSRLCSGWGAGEVLRAA